MTFFGGPTMNEDTQASNITAGTGAPGSRRASASLNAPSQSQPPATLTSRVRNIMLPSRRPERGGTVRKRGYWEGTETSEHAVPKSRRRFTDSHQSLASGNDDERLVRWNTAKDVSQSDTEAMQPPKRAFSVGHKRVKPPGIQQQWSWMPRGFRQGSEIGDGQEGTQLPVPGDDEAFQVPRLEASDNDAAAVAERRLSKAQRLIEAKRKIRHQRRNLKESGDYLGVQGINPDTGELDLITPTDSEGSSAGRERERKLHVLREKLRQAREESKESASGAALEAEDVLQELETEARVSANKEALKKMNEAVKWRRQTKQWSSAQEPNLSPIAQSRRSTMPASPPPRPIDSPEGVDPVPLIDITTPANPKAAQGVRAVSFADAEGQRASGSTPGSHGTVVRTPYRQSFANLSSAALELFENGISFSRSRDDDAEADATKAPSRKRQHSGARVTHDTRDPSHGIKHSHSDRPAPPKGARISLPEVSFSGIGPGTGRRPPDPYSTDKGGRLLVSSSPSPYPMVLQENTETVMSPAEPAPQSRRGRHMKVVRRTFESLRTPSARTPDLSASLSPDLKGLRKWMPAQLRDRSPRPKGIQSQEDTRQIHRSPALHSVTNQTSSSKIAFHGQLQSSPHPHLSSPLEQAIKERVQAEMVTLRQELAELNSSRIPTVHQEQAQHTDQEWIDNTIREITKCGDANREEHACTPIITTTGSGRPVSRYYQTPVTASSTQSPAAYQSECRSTGSSRSTETVGGKTVRSLAKTYSSTSPSLTSETSDKAGDTTSGRQLWAMKDRIAKLVGHNTDIKQEPYTPTARRSTRHMSTSTQPKRSVGGANNRRVGPATYPRMGTVKHRTIKLKIVQPIRTDLTTALHRVRRVSKGTREPEQRLRMPGSYPEEKDDDVVTADLFRSLVRKVGGFKVPLALLRLLRVLCMAGFQLVQMYWRFVRPMAVARSEFWERQAKRQLTWEDSVRTLLAAPGAVVALTMFV